MNSDQLESTPTPRPLDREDDPKDQPQAPEPPESVIFTPEALWGRDQNPLQEDDDGSETAAPYATQWLAELEALASSGHWQRIVDLLSSSNEPSDLSPTLRLVYAIACKETSDEAQPLGTPERLAITAMSELLGVAPDSPIAVMIAKRMLRSKRPWIKREAPKGPISVLLMLFALGLGALVGWLSTML